MNKAAGKVCMAKLSRCKQLQAENHARAAELLAEESRLIAQLAEGESVDLRTGRQRPTHYPIRAMPPDVTPEEDAEALRALRESNYKRRVSTK